MQGSYTGSASLRIACPSTVLPSSKQLLRRVFEKLTGTHIFRTLPRGIDHFHDIKTSLPNLRVDTVFDVGANVGQSAYSYLMNLPRAMIYCFEPVTATHRQLEARLHGRENIRIFKLALGAEEGLGTMVLEGQSDMFFLRRGAGEPTASADIPLEQVPVETLDGFCARESARAQSFGSQALRRLRCSI